MRVCIYIILNTICKKTNKYIYLYIDIFICIHMNIYIYVYIKYM